jgi:hypothetical protein
VTGRHRTIWIDGAASEDEVAAAMAAIRLVLEEQERSASRPSPSRWTLLGRLEAQGVIPNERAMRRGWRAIDVS